MTGYPKKPGYLDKKAGRYALVLTSQNIRVDEEGNVSFPSFLNGIRIRARHDGIRQVRVITESDRIRILLLYEQPKAETTKADGCMGIDPGVNNLLALSMDNSAEPILINGRPLKSINQYYNRKKARLTSEAMKINGTYQTKRIRKLTDKRNRKITDYLHKASRMVIRTAQENGIGTIVIGRAAGWKQQTSLSKKDSQNFTSIPHWKLVSMICYKAELAGIHTVLVDEYKYASGVLAAAWPSAKRSTTGHACDPPEAISQSEIVIPTEIYTSGTSYPDGEPPKKQYYRKERRKKRGLFVCDDGYRINADTNAAYQMMKKAGYGQHAPKKGEKVTLLQVA